MSPDRISAWRRTARVFWWVGILSLSWLAGCAVNPPTVTPVATPTPVDGGLLMVIAFENLSGGMGTAAFVAFLMALCKVRYSATQFALLSALAAVTRGQIAAQTIQSIHIGMPEKSMRVVDNREMHNICVQDMVCAALVRGGAQREAAQRFLEFLRSAPAQEALQTSMWMFAAEPGTSRPDVMRHASEPAAHDSPGNEAIAARGADWVGRWTTVVLK